MRILRASDHKRMPWKNGGGETTEIAVFPENAGLSDFDWRVSMARVDHDGPFSSFPGIDRTLAILEGAGIVLDIDGEEAAQLTLDTEPHTFPADAPTSARLIDGTVTDFNVMSRRGKVEHRVTRLRDRHNAPAGSLYLVLCARGAVAISTSGTSETLNQYDAALIADYEMAELVPSGEGEFYLVVFRSL